MSLSRSVFKRYDIRGNADRDFADSDIVTLGCAIGTYFVEQLGVMSTYVGADNRLSSERLRTHLTEGLLSVGVDVIDLGTVSTPNLYWYAASKRTAGIMITGSHLDPEFNGFKLCVGVQALHSEAIQSIYRLTESRQFAVGQGKREVEAGAVVTYLDAVSRKVAMGRRLRVAVDCGNGTSGLYTELLFRNHWQHDLIAINQTLDGRFPSHSPDPQHEENLSELRRLVVDQRADIGLIFDGDADRVVAVDERGAIIRPDRMLALLAQDALSRNPGATIIADVTSSQTVFDAVRQSGGTGIMWKTGHSLIKEKMQATNAILAGEISGHIFFAEDYFGFDDAYLAAGKLLQVLSHTTDTLAELDSRLPTYVSSKVYRLPYSADIVADVLAALRHDLGGQADIIELDGIRANFPNGWFVVRSSNTEPVLSIRIEGKTAADVDVYRNVLVDTLRGFDRIDISDLAGNA
ncbi:MAG: phosphomannomutase/phosphoglucomutase [Anaerolinea sp.]|nr:phosphomannomutase/phosphoglucomutase [Anaerolinea sp.]